MITLDKQPSVDLIGVKAWSFPAALGRLTVFERPPAYLAHSGYPAFMLRLERGNGAHVATEYRRTRPSAEACARRLAEKESSHA